jgi:protein-L-isoaspartate(D-aspartate) O-methyltransferase
MSVSVNQRQRDAMVRFQLSARGVCDARVLEAMSAVPRHLFVPEQLEDEAYSDQALGIGGGQTISQPYVVAVMTEALELSGQERVLEVGTGSGYQTALLAELAAEVYTIEILARLADRASRLFGRLGYSNIRQRVGDAYLGWSDAAPFDRVIVTAAPSHVPPALVEQLAEGGRLVIPVGEQLQELHLMIKDGQRLRMRRLLPVRFVPMTGLAQGAAAGDHQ